MNRKEISTWWQRGIEKERVRLTNTPKAHKGDRFSVAEDFSNFAPPLTFAKKEKHRARKR